MNKKIHIEKIQIRLKGSTATRARSIGQGLGDEVLKLVAENSGSKSGSLKIENLNSGKISSGQGVPAAALRGQIARRIADLISDRMK